jgi:DNA repair exonuclease SbcCD nuclease subunit
MGLIRILLIADTHLGFDLPFRPCIKRRRRGPDFFANFERALRALAPKTMNIDAILVDYRHYR